MAINLNDKYKPDERFKAVVDHGRGLLVVCAGPGTGKTYSLLRKIESLLNSGSDPSQIYYLTFVNSIVDAFDTDISKPFSKGGLGKSSEELGINISTLHSLAFKIVKTYSQKLGLPEHLEVIELEPRSENFLTKVFLQDLIAYSKSLNIFKDKKDFDSQLCTIVRCWRENVSIPNVNKALNDCIIKICYRYQVCPWDSLVPTANRAIKDYGLPKWLGNAKHFLIDEYQDFNPSEQYLISLITEPSDSVIVVGDPDQSIYSSRAASPSKIKELLNYSDTYTVNFVHCRRCPKTIIKSANNLLKHYVDPEGYIAKELLPFRPDDGNVEILRFKSCKAEIEYLVNKIKELQQNEESSIIILFPFRKARDFYAKKFEELGIACLTQTTGRSDEKLVTYLKLARLQSHHFLERLIISQFPNLEKKYTVDVLPTFLDSGENLVTIIQTISSQKKWKKEIIQELEILKCVISQLESKAANRISEGLKTLGYDVSQEVICRLLNDEDIRNPKEIVDDIIEQVKPKSAEISQGGASYVRLLTMHSAKGLSKTSVIIPAFEDKWLPGPKRGESLAEQHRLIYVAITRAEEQVIITFPKTRARGDPLNYALKNTNPGISRYANSIAEVSEVTS